jgi:hypothetical protein
MASRAAAMLLVVLCATVLCGFSVVGLDAAIDGWPTANASKMGATDRTLRDR